MGRFELEIKIYFALRTVVLFVKTYKIVTQKKPLMCYKIFMYSFIPNNSGWKIKLLQGTIQ